MGRDASNLGFSSISVDQESLLEYGSLLQAVALFFHPLLQDIAKSKYRVITISPKLIINPKFLSMFKKPPRLQADYSNHCWRPTVCSFGEMVALSVRGKLQRLGKRWG